MIYWDYTNYDGQFGTRYAFECAGEKIPFHDHDPGEGHTIRCLRGSVKYKTYDVEVELTPDDGEFFFMGEITHSITATADHTIIFNRMESPPPNADELLGTGDVVPLP